MQIDKDTLSVQYSSDMAKRKTPLLQKTHMQTTAILFWHQGGKNGKLVAIN